jgi:hypothetical protein
VRKKKREIWQLDFLLISGTIAQKLGKRKARIFIYIMLNRKSLKEEGKRYAENK